MILGLAVGFYYLDAALRTISNITAPQIQVTNVSVYVKKDSPVNTVEELLGQDVGIVSNMNRENTDETLKKFSNELGQKLKTREYPRIEELAAALRQGEVAAIICDGGYFALLEETEDFADFQNEIRELAQIRVEREIVKPTLPPAGNPVEKQEVVENVPQVDPDAFILYISGIDTSGPISYISRSDVNILAVVNPNTRQIVLVSTPRDFFVPLSISGGVPDKLTHAGIYGVQVSMDTLGMLYEIPVDYYFRVNFNGFEDIIDALGGVTVYSAYDFGSGINSFYEGMNELNGSQALAFARDRYSFQSGDRQRGKNQMEVIKAVIRKCMSPAILTGYMDILNAVEGSFETSMPYDKIAELIRSQLSEGGEWNVMSVSADGTGGSEIPFSMSQYAYVMYPDMDTVNHARELIAKVRAGEILE